MINSDAQRERTAAQIDGFRQAPAKGWASANRSLAVTRRQTIKPAQYPADRRFSTQSLPKNKRQTHFDDS